MKKAIVFVDANNLYHCVKSVRNPNKIDFLRLGQVLCEIKNYQFVKMIWYASIPDLEDNPENYYAHLSFLNALERKGIEVVKRKLQKTSKSEINERRRNIFSKLQLCPVCKRIFKMFSHLIIKTKREKGIDVWCAIDMIKCSLIEKDCDVCLLISGDADFIPALNLIKQHQKEVLVASVRKGFSKELRDNFEYFVIKEETLNKCLRNTSNKKLKK